MEQAEAHLPLPTEQITKALSSGVRSTGASWDQIPDLLQDAWVALLRQAAHLESVASSALPSYIRRIGRSAAIDSLRRQSSVKRGGRASVVSMDCDLAPTQSADPERIAIGRQAFRQAVRAASGRSRRAPEVLGLLSGGLSPAAIAERLAISRGSVYAVLHQARRRREALRLE